MTINIDIWHVIRPLPCLGQFIGQGYRPKFKDMAETQLGNCCDGQPWLKSRHGLEANK